MKTTAYYLDALRVKLDLPSDNRLASHLGIHRQYISRYRNNAVTFDDAGKRVQRPYRKCAGGCLRYASKGMLPRLWVNSGKAFILGGMACFICPDGGTVLNHVTLKRGIFRFNRCGL